MILDDGGDATLLVHKGTEYEAAGAVPDPAGADSEEFHVILSLLQRSLGEDPQRWTRIGEGIKGVTEETTTGVHRLYEMTEAGDPAVPGDQCQRLGDEVEVRQPLRLPPLAGGRHQPRHRRDDRRQDRRDLRLRRRRQGLRRIAARPGRARGRHRDRPDLRAAGRDAGLHDPHARGSGGGGRHLRHLHRQPRHHPRRAHGADEAPGDRRQHWALRQRDRHRRPRQGAGHRADQHQAAGGRVGLPRRPRDHPALRGPPAEPRQRHRPPELRDEQLLHQPDDRPDRAVHEER